MLIILVFFKFFFFFKLILFCASDERKKKKKKKRKEKFNKDKQKQQRNTTQRMGTVRSFPGVPVTSSPEQQQTRVVFFIVVSCVFSFAYFPNPKSSPELVPH